MSLADSPMAFRWVADVLADDGGAMVPIRAQSAARRYKDREEYVFVEYHDRSLESHDHQFAFIGEAWKQLPEKVMDLYPSPLALRKAALIDTGWFDEELIDCSTKAAAERVAASIRKRSDFSLVIIRGVFVIIRDAKSQSRRAMEKKDFQASKTAILEWVAALIGVTPETLTQNAGRAA